MQIAAYEYFSKLYGRALGVVKGKNTKKKSEEEESALGQWKNRLFYACADADGGVLPSEVEKIKKWNVSDFLEMLEYKMEYADSRR